MYQTAVQWLVNYMEENFHLTDEAYEIMLQAKLMEKGQISEAYRTRVEKIKEIFKMELPNIARALDW